jgi:LPS-assembly lipoprotein
MFDPATALTIKYLRYLSVMLLIIVVSGCGFQLRGALDLSDEISPLYLERNSVFKLARELKLLLATNNISVTDDMGRSSTQLTLLTEEKNRRVLTVDGDGRVREYLLTYTINFLVNTERSAPDQSVKKEMVESISLSRSLLFDTEAVLAVTNESEILYKDMRRNAARLILLRLQARVRKDTAPIVAPADKQSSSTTR